ncbi:MAG: dTDP-Rha--alpha-D-GlcNAc-pyrophosphate polyprenol alpha-3-L-rhamnosyltransferase [Bacteroidetes bacterium MedPE-SWsnd-G2]|nr:MAG: dTDP-Rha--alpha-D-GlcNAc-pyrophosphate polyprenol alpha-3-L-rhamnosyltransferase [Bacteroidetes bacterium MedPE-SWsnd-G2]
MEIAVVILNWNGKQLLEEFLPTVMKHSKEQAQVYLADNASTDDSILFVTTHFSEVKIIKNESNGGYAKGYNDALKQVSEPIFCLLNSDVAVTKNWLTPIIKQFSSEPNTAIIQPKLLDYKNPPLFEYAGAAGGFIDKYGYPYCRGRIFDTVEEDKNQYDAASIFWASGACLFIRKNVFLNLNGFDETFFAHMEEIDLCWRAHNQGLEIKYNPDSTVLHLGGGTLSAINPQKTYLNFRNSLFTLTKNAKGPLLLLIFVRLLLDGLAGVKFLFSFQFKHILAIVHAHFGFYYALPRLLKQRKSTLEKRDYYKLNSIVWQYFARKSKFYHK